MQQITIRAADREKQHLDKYCEMTERTINDVLREYIRSLAVSGALSPIDDRDSHPDAHPDG